MFVGLDDDGVVDTRYEDKSAEELMKHVPDVVLHKVPDEIGEIGKGIYKYKVVDGMFVLKDDLSDFVKQNKPNKPSSTRIGRREMNSSQKQTVL